MKTWCLNGVAGTRVNLEPRVTSLPLKRLSSTTRSLWPNHQTHQQFTHLWWKLRPSLLQLEYTGVHSLYSRPAALQGRPPHQMGQSWAIQWVHTTLGGMHFLTNVIGCIGALGTDSGCAEVLSAAFAGVAKCCQERSTHRTSVPLWCWLKSYFAQFSSQIKRQQHDIIHAWAAEASWHPQRPKQDIQVLGQCHHPPNTSMYEVCSSRARR